MGTFANELLAPELRVIVAQMGARHNYAIPRMLHQNGCLAALYTDFCFSGQMGRFIRGVAPMGSHGGVGAKMLRRCVHNIPSQLVRCSAKVNFRSWLARPASLAARYQLENSLFGDAMIRWGPRDANVIYAMFGNGLKFLEDAKMRGLKIAVDVFITPIVHRIEKMEREMFPDWEPTSAPDFAIKERHIDAMLELADLLVCPAPTVVDGLRAYNGFDERRVRVVPYGNAAKLGGSGRPTRGCVLFAGTAGLRKGIHYFARAAKLLYNAGYRYQFKVAGGVTDLVRNHSDVRPLTFLGHLSRERMNSEFLSADIFVLPTLAEGSASVVFEALSASLPVVTTRSAGSIVTHGKEGFIVPERDPETLAEAIVTIIEDRELREKMARTAFVTSQNYTEAQWGARLLGSLRSVLHR